MATKFARMVIYFERHLTKIIQSFDQVILQGRITNKNVYISNTRVSIVTKLGRMMTYLDGFLYNVTCPFDHVVLQSHVTNESH